MTKGWFGRFDWPGLAPAVRPLLRVAGRGRPACDSLSFASPKESKQRKGDPGCCVPPLRYGQPAVLGSGGVSLNSLRSNNAIPDPSGPPLLGASTRGGDGIPNPNTEKPQGLALASPCLSWFVLWNFSSVPDPAPDCPVLAGPRSAETSGSGLALFERSEFSQTPLGLSTAGCP